jgi:hypothetical protein
MDAAAIRAVPAYPDVGQLRSSSSHRGHARPAVTQGRPADDSVRDDLLAFTVSRRRRTNSAGPTPVGPSLRPASTSSAAIQHHRHGSLVPRTLVIAATFRSRGTLIGTSPISVRTVLAECPLRTFPPHPGIPPYSWPKCSVRSASQRRLQHLPSQALRG